MSTRSTPVCRRGIDARATMAVAGDQRSKCRHWTASGRWSSVRLAGTALLHQRPVWNGRTGSPHLSETFCRAASSIAVGNVKDCGMYSTEDGRRLQVLVADMGLNTITIRCLDWDRDRFDIEFGLQNGTTYNSYVIFGEEKTALVDSSHEKFREYYMPVLRKELEDRGRTLDYLIVSHTEPDHSGLTKDVVDLYPNVEVIGSKVCIAFLEGLTHVNMKTRVVKGGDTVDLGPGHLVEFVIAPNLHWPDTMFSYDHKSQIMFTCDAFGMHYCSDDPYDTDLSLLDDHYRFYYDCLMKPNARSVTTALRKVKDMPYMMIGNGHGPLLKYNVPEMVGRYQTWSEATAQKTTSVLILYSSDYGYSDRLSQTLARGITKADVPTEMMDLLSVDPQELVEAVGRSAAIVLMAHPSDSSQAKASMGTLLSAVKSKQTVVIAESFGGKDEPVDQLCSAFVAAGLEPLIDPLRVKDTPSENTYQLFEECGTDLAQALTQKDSIAKKKSAMSGDVAKALARISGGLYIVTAGNANAQGAAKGAMVASWVSQASFEPLGITIAVAKDRAIESLMQVGDNFVLNCLGEGEFSPIMKHFLQRFPAGADRFDGIKWSVAENGSPVLEDAIASIECKVMSRMETADHWVTYAEVTQGSVAKADKRTAVHRRKVANYY